MSRIGYSTDIESTVEVRGIDSNWQGYEGLVVGVEGQGVVRVGNGAQLTQGIEGGFPGGVMVGYTNRGTLEVLSGAEVITQFDAVIGHYVTDWPSARTGHGDVSVKRDGSRWTIHGGLMVGNDGIGELSVINGGEVVAGSAIISNGPDLAEDDRDWVDVIGTGSRLTVDNGLRVGVDGTGQMFVQHGGQVRSGNAGVGTGLGEGKVYVKGKDNNNIASKWRIEGSLDIGGWEDAATGKGSLLIQDGGGVEVWGNVHVWDQGLLRIGRANEPSQGEKLTIYGQKLTLASVGSLQTDGVFKAEPGATIQFFGTSLIIEGSDPADVDGLANTRLIFAGGEDVIDTIEVCGHDLGGDWEAFHDNFTFGTLEVGTPDRPGHVRLINDYFNQDVELETEALYVKELIIHPGSSLDLDGREVYALNYRNQGGTLLLGDGDPGALTQVEPIQSFHASDLETVFQSTGGQFDLGALSIRDEVDIMVASASNQQSYDGGAVDITTSLIEDLSQDGVAHGLFSGGELSFSDELGATLLEAEVHWLEMQELENGLNLLVAQGLVQPKDGLLAEAFLVNFGELVQVTFQLDHPDLADFQQDFSGVTNLALVAIPEPTTLALCVFAALAAAIRMRARIAHL